MGFNQKIFLESVKSRTYVILLFPSIVLCENKTFKIENNSRQGILVISPLLPVFILFANPRDRQTLDTGICRKAVMQNYTCPYFVSASSAKKTQQEHG